MPAGCVAGRRRGRLAGRAIPPTTVSVVEAHRHFCQARRGNAAGRRWLPLLQTKQSGVGGFTSAWHCRRLADNKMPAGAARNRGAEAAAGSAELHRSAGALAQPQGPSRRAGLHAAGAHAQVPRPPQAAGQSGAGLLQQLQGVRGLRCRKRSSRHSQLLPPPPPAAATARLRGPQRADTSTALPLCTIDGIKGPEGLLILLQR